jgi:hypothetical protein
MTARFDQFRSVGLMLTLLICTATFALAADTPAIHTSLSLDRATSHIGEPVVGTVAIEWTDKFDPLVLNPGEKVGDFDVLKYEPGTVEQKDKSTRRRIDRLTLSCFELGDNTAGPVEVSFKDPSGKIQSIKTNAVPCKIASVLAELETSGTQVTLRPIRPPMEWPTDRQAILRWALVGLAIVLAIVLIVFIIRKLRRKNKPAVKEEVKPLLPADVEALNALDALAGSGLVDGASPKPYYSELSDILRRYLGRRYHCDALEMTSSELLDEIDAHRWERTLFDSLQAHLTETDGVKFARYEPSRPRRMAALELVRQIVLSTRIVSAPVAENGRKGGEASHV